MGWGRKGKRGLRKEKRKVKDDVWEMKRRKRRRTCEERRAGRERGKGRG